MEITFELLRKCKKMTEERQRKKKAEIAAWLGGKDVIVSETPDGLTNCQWDGVTEKKVFKNACISPIADVVFGRDDDGFIATYTLSGKFICSVDLTGDVKEQQKPE